MISIVFALVASVMSITVGATVTFSNDGEEMTDLRAIDPNKMEPMGFEVSGKHLVTLPTRKLVGLERFTYPFTHPQIGKFYLQGVGTWFIGLFLQRHS